MAFLFPLVGSVIENKAQRVCTCRLLATNVLAPHCIWNLIFWLFFLHFVSLEMFQNKAYSHTHLILNRILSLKSFTHRAQNKTLKQQSYSVKWEGALPAKTCGTQWLLSLKTAKVLLGGPRVVIHATIYPMWYTGGKDVRAIFGTTGQTGDLLLLLFGE